MKEIFEKIIVNLETEVLKSSGNMTRTYAFEKAIEIVKQESEQYTSTEHINCSSDSSTNG